MRQYFILSSFLNSMFDFNRSKFNDVKTQSLKKLKREINFSKFISKILNFQVFVKGLKSLIII